MIKEINIDVDFKVKHALSLGFRDDGSMVVKKGSSTIIKNSSLATVKGELVKQFKDDVLEDIGLVQKCFTR